MVRAGDRRVGARAGIEELRRRRAFECRLTPDRALQTLDEAQEFLLDRGLLTRTADSALPSLFAACHEEPYAPESPGFGQWPRQRLPSRSGIVSLAPPISIERQWAWPFGSSSRGSRFSVRRSQSSWA